MTLYADGLCNDNTADVSDALQALVNEARPTGEQVRLGPGVFRISKPVRGSGAFALAGEGPERTVITPPVDASALVVGSPEVSGPHGVHLSGVTFRHNGNGANTAAPMVDVVQYGRKWVIDQVHFDADFSNRPGLAVTTSWVGSIRDCNWWKFGTEGKAGQRAAVIVAPARLPNGNGPINNVTFDSCAWERCQAGVDLHDPAELAASTAIYSVSFISPRFKNTSTDGPMPNSVGVRSNSNQTFGITFDGPFFEDIATGILVRGWGWHITSPFGQSADVVVDLVTGGGHQVHSMVLQGSDRNRVGVGVLARSGVSRKCLVTVPTSVTGATYLGALTKDESGGKLAVTAA